MVVNIAISFVLLGAIIFIGFLGSILFNRTKISELLILVLLGVLIGPVFKLVDHVLLAGFIPFFAALALLILLFDGGLNINFYKVLYELPKATIFTVFTFITSVLAIGLISKFALGWSLELGILLGAVIGGTSSAIVMTLLDKVKANEEIKTMLKLESAITDALCIVVAITMAQIITAGSFSLSNSINSIAGGFSIAAIIGIIAAVFWTKFLAKFKGKFDYMLTLAAAFIVYGIVEFAQGNGGIAVLLFGVVLGNARKLHELFTKTDAPHLEVTDSIKSFQSEISFFVRTFFFVYIGLILKLEAISLFLLIIGTTLTLIALLARRFTVKVLGYEKTSEKTLIYTMMPRGLAAAVLASVPTTYGINAPGFTELVMIVIIVSNIITTLGVFKSENIQPTPQKQAIKKPKIIKTTVH